MESECQIDAYTLWNSGGHESENNFQLVNDTPGNSPFPHASVFTKTTTKRAETSLTEEDSIYYLQWTIFSLVRSAMIYILQSFKRVWQDISEISSSDEKDPTLKNATKNADGLG